MENPNQLLAKIEAAGLWAYFHKDWLLEIRNDLRPQLPPSYHVFVESETVLVTPEAPLSATLPDIAVARADQAAVQLETAASGTAAVIEVDEPYELVSQYTLVIRRAPHNAVVAALELLSPSNKGIGNRLDRDKHLRKRDAFLDAGVNFLEVDALLEGQRDLPPTLLRMRAYDRIAWAAMHLSGRRRFRAWGWNAEEPIPQIPWTVEERLSVLVDLSATLAKAFEFNRWDSMVAQGGQ